VKAVQPDRSEILRAVALLAEPGQLVELRLLDVHLQGQRFPATMSGYFDSVELLADGAVKYGCAAKGVYVTLNPMNPALIARASNRLRTVGKRDPLTSDTDITKRRWLPIDLDPGRPSGVSSTEQEHSLAVERAFEVREALRQMGWPDPIISDSGNGTHLLYRVELAANDNELVKRCLQALAQRFDDERVKIDQAVFNPARIWKLYGTISRKGDSVAERPHRLARILEAPAMTTVPVGLLETLAHVDEENASTRQASIPAAGFDIETWIAACGLDVEGPQPWNGGRRWRFPICPWDGAHTNKSAYIVQLPNGAIAAGCHHKGCGGKDWRALRDQLEPGWRSAFQGPRAAETCCHAPWEPPIPFQQIALPPFPTEALPVWLRLFVEAEATATQTPMDLAGMLTLSVLATCCAKKVVVCMREGYTEPVNMFTVTSLASGNRKTAVFAAVTRPLEDYERAEAQRTSKLIAGQQAERAIQESILKGLKERAAAAKEKNERERLTREAAELAAELETEITASPTRYITDDCTPERLSTLLHEQGGRIAVMSAEGDIFDIMAGRYSTKGMGNFGVFLKGHAGDALRTDRVGRSESVKAPAITIGLAVQPDVIRGLAEKPGFRGRGLLGRFLYALPESLLGRRDPDAPPVPGDIRAAYHDNVTALLALPFGTDENGAPGPHLLHFSPEAQASIRDFEVWLEPQLAEFGELGGMTDWAGKLVGAVGRIAGILHMALYADTSTPWTIPILRGTVENAIRIGKYLIPNAKAAFAEMGTDEVVERAKAILRWIEHQNARHFTKRDVHQALKGSFKLVEELEAPLELLVSHGYVRRPPEPMSAGPGRKPSPTFEVNPLWASQNSHNPQNRKTGPNSEDCEDSEDCERGPAKTDLLE
jgi:replicative DNA helicase